ncbi:BLUF domain-containing protein [Azospirillum picis]|uniref:BLUF domain-containing protein n=1 Tax=Azospirillum picis TaxID=488438 RepID=A0ABU0MH94_9PROT|nr:BLUF domain-containing protein [Azospirillum picis]MBP2298956.1 hypothetical protein [Azospirillum picis]MDQ0532802.1 hypothetical protein [Azospirillum picis]
MKTLLYRSDAVALLPFSALADICVRSARKNRTLGITGFLVEHEGTFLQILEGESDAVLALFERIEADTRHTNVTVTLCHDSGPDRSFGFWAMNVGPLDDPSFWTGDFAGLRRAGEFRSRSRDPDVALAVLRRAYEFAVTLAGKNEVIANFIRGGHP